MKNSGFTLLELLVVIGIIGILAATLIPNLLNARSAAKNSDAQTIARNSVTMAEIKRSENNDEPLFLTASSCVPNLYASLPGNVLDCQVRQDGNTSYVLVKSSTGLYFYFNGMNLTGPLNSAPASW